MIIGKGRGRSTEVVRRDAISEDVGSNPVAPPPFLERGPALRAAGPAAALPQRSVGVTHVSSSAVGPTTSTSVPQRQKAAAGDDHDQGPEREPADFRAEFVDGPVPGVRGHGGGGGQVEYGSSPAGPVGGPFGTPGLAPMAART